MALKPKYVKGDEVPQEQRSHYVERDGMFVLDIEGGYADPARLSEFRDNNTALKRQIEELTQRFEGIDVAEVRKLAAEKKRLEEEAALKAGEFDKVLNARLASATGELQKQLQSLGKERDGLNERLTSLTLDKGVLEAAAKRGLRASAAPDLQARARGVFRLVDGVPVAFEADGQTVRKGKDGSSPMTLEEWVSGLATEAPHLFESNAGGGASGNGTGGVGGARNPFRKGPDWNLTEQMRLLRNNPELAERMKAAG